jgi:hypothetical protein
MTLFAARNQLLAVMFIGIDSFVLYLFYRA